MKNVKIIGLAAIAALALMASLGAGSASATALCSAQPEEVGGDLVCKAGTRLEKTVQLQAVAVGGVNFDPTPGDLGCEKAELKEFEVAQKGTIVEGVIGQYDFKICQYQMAWLGCKKNPATVTLTVKPKIEFTYTSKTEQSLSIYNPTMQVYVNCAKPATCTFGESDIVKGSWSNSGQSLSMVSQWLSFNKKTGEGVCPSYSPLSESVTYNVVRMNGLEELPVYVAKE